MHPDLLAVTDYWKNDSEVCRKVAYRTKLLQHPAGISDLSSFNILDLDEKPVEGQLRSFASRSDWWMITDGFLYYKVPEPLISLEVERGYGEPGPLSCKVATLESILANLQQFRSRRTVGIYSLAQMDDAMARAENLVTNHKCVAERLTVPVSVTRRDLFETRPLELNAAAFAAFFLYYFFDYRLPFIDKRRLAEVVRLGTERLSLVSELDENLTAFLEGRSTTSLLETVTSILDLPDNDPLWEKYSPFWVEHRGFVRHCLDDRIVIADFHPQGCVGHMQHPGSFAVCVAASTEE